MASHDLRYYYLTTYLADVSTAGQCYVHVPTDFGSGKIVRIETVLNGAIATADAALTAKINGTAVTGGTITIANSSSAAGDRDSCVPTGANVVAGGDQIEIETDGASTNTIPVFITITIAR